MRFKFSTIKIKLGIVILVIAFISFGVVAFFSITWMTSEIKGDYKEKADLIKLHVIHDLESSMILKDHPGIHETLEIYRGYERQVEEILVFDSRGQEAFLAGKGVREARVEEVIRTGQPVVFDKRIGGREAIAFIFPIMNKPACYGCHGKDQPIRGAVLLSLNKREMEKYIKRHEQKFLALFGLIGVGILIAGSIVVNRLLLKPLSLIQRGTEAIGRGEFQHRIPVQSKDEIGSLAENFNRMAGVLQEKNEMLWEHVRLLSRSQREWQETFDSITDLVAIVDKDFNITRANRAFYRYFSLPPLVEINKKCYEIIGSCLQSNCPHEKVLHDQSPVIDEVADSKTGKMLQISVFPYHSLSEEFLGSIFIAKDITEKKENEMSRIMSERLAALGQIAAGIAHEINNPLATIAACAEGLLKRVRSSRFEVPFFENYLKMVEEEVNRCKNIAQSMLSFVRKASTAKQEVDVNETLDRTLELISFQGRLNQVEVLRNYQEKSLGIHGNEGELRQAFLSIMLNALDAMGDKGTLTLETGRIPPSPPLEKGGEGGFALKESMQACTIVEPTLETGGGDGGLVFIRIRDSGPGIPSGLLSRIFDPFFTTKSEKGGTGLGLSIAKRIIANNSGTIEVASDEGKGATFTITLPTTSTM